VSAIFYGTKNLASKKQLNLKSIFSTFASYLRILDCKLEKLLQSSLHLSWALVISMVQQGV
jgi:hypothetical protein